MKNINNIVKKVVNEAINEISPETMARAYVKAGVDRDNLDSSNDATATNLNGEKVHRNTQKNRRERQEDTFRKGLNKSLSNEFNKDVSFHRHGNPNTTVYGVQTRKGKGENGPIDFHHYSESDGNRGSVYDSDFGSPSLQMKRKDMKAIDRVSNLTDAMTGYHNELTGNKDHQKRLSDLNDRINDVDAVNKYYQDTKDYEDAVSNSNRDIANFKSQPWWKKIGKKAPEPFTGKKPETPKLKTGPYFMPDKTDGLYKEIDRVKGNHDAQKNAYEKYLKKEDKQMKKQLIRITESDLTNMIIEAVNKLKEAYFPNEYDHMLNPPATYFYNKDTQEITQDVNSNGVWVEFVPNEYTNHGFKVKSAFIDREDGTEEELPEEMTLTPEEINYIKNWLENNG